MKDLRLFLRRTYIGTILTVLILRSAAWAFAAGISEPITSAATGAINFVLAHLFRNVFPLSSIGWVALNAALNVALGFFLLAVAFYFAEWLFPYEQRP